MLFSFFGQADRKKILSTFINEKVPVGNCFPGPFTWMILLDNHAAAGFTLNQGAAFDF